MTNPAATGGVPMTATGKLGKVELRQAFSGHFAEKSA